MNSKLNDKKRKLTKSVFFLTFSKILNLLIGFLARRLFIQIIAVEYLGLNSLYSNILGLLSLAELGIGSALEVRFYKPLVDKDEEKIQNLLSLARKIYFVIGTAVFLIGSSITYFVPYLVNENTFDPNYIRLAFFINVCGIAFSYFCADKRLLLSANENLYIVNLSDTLMKIVSTLFGLLILYFTHEYLWYALISGFQSFFSNLLLLLLVKVKRRKIAKEKTNSSFQSLEKKAVLKNMKDLLPNKIAVAVFSSTDSIVISAIIGLSAVAYYTNYQTIINAFLSIATIISTSLFSTFGKAIKSNAPQKSVFDNFKKYQIFQFLYSSLATVGMFCLINKVIVIWMGDSSFVLDNLTIYFMIFDFWIHSMYQPLSTMFIATEQFKKDKYVSLISAGLNILISIISAHFIGLAGVILGTLISNLFIFFFRDFIIIKDYFHLSLLKDFCKTALSLLLTAIECLASYFIIKNIPINNKWLSLFIGIIVCVCVWGIPSGLIFCKSGFFSFLPNKKSRKLKKHLLNRIDISK